MHTVQCQINIDYDISKRKSRKYEIIQRNEYTCYEERSKRIKRDGQRWIGLQIYGIEQNIAFLYEIAFPLVF